MTKIESEEKLSKLVIDYHISKFRKSEKCDCTESHPEILENDSSQEVQGGVKGERWVQGTKKIKVKLLKDQKIVFQVRE